MPEIVLNLHMHTVYSDGSGSHRDIANAALQTGVDVVLVTDHNLLVRDMDGYYQAENTPTGSRKVNQPSGKRRVLLLVGEEIHDPARQPPKNHLLVFNTGRELAPYAAKPQGLVDQIAKAGGLSFIAHPNDPALPAFNEPDISWVDWDVRGFTGIELWNGFSELKSVVHSLPGALLNVFFPRLIAHGPLPQTLRKWDELTGRGAKVVAVGGSDAHAMKANLGPLHKTVFPYTFHFSAINNHLLIDKDLTGDLAQDRALIYDALRKGHSYIGYDLPASTKGFRFTTQGEDGLAGMGDEIRLKTGLTFQVKLPLKAECRLIRDGEVVKTWQESQNCTYIGTQKGVYRVECYLPYLGKRRGWIFSNPIYVR